MPLERGEQEQRRACVLAMNAAAAAGVGPDVVIVSAASRRDAEFWQARLESVRGQIVKPDAVVLPVHEDWPGGAGNGLGTLHAVAQAREKAARLCGRDILADLRAGAALSLFHTAGKGMRLAPLPLCEHNNKSAVKLAGLAGAGTAAAPLTILEAVIKQTAIFAPGRRGRLSVFWGDQVFIPAKGPLAAAGRHAEILVKLRPLPTAAEWEQDGLDRYGLVAVDRRGNASQVEKVSFAAAAGLMDRGAIDAAGGIGLSLGSFSVSAELLAALLDEFRAELASRRGRLDTDPHFWMPLSLDPDTYAAIMSEKGTDGRWARGHHERMQGFKERLAAGHPRAGLLGAADVGAGSLWWDFGSLAGFHKSLLQLAGDGPEPELLRLFLGIEGRRIWSAVAAGADVDEGSCLLASRVGGGRVRRSVLVAVEADHLDVEDSVLIAVNAASAAGRACLMYNLRDPLAVAARRGTVRAGVNLGGGEDVIVEADLECDGKKSWEVRLPGNPMSFAELHELIRARVEAEPRGPAP